MNARTARRIRSGFAFGHHLTTLPRRDAMRIVNGPLQNTLTMRAARAVWARSLRPVTVAA